MYTSILVKIEFIDKNIDLDKKIELSFEITNIGVKYKIGTNLGGNIAKPFIPVLQKLKNYELIFELTDCPMDTQTVDLFSGDCPTDNSEKHVALVYESLFSRMDRVQRFFEELLDNKNIKNVIVDIDAENTFDYQEFDKIRIKVSKFRDKMIELFEENNQFTPTIRIIFEK
ncbi:hypothetical protein L6269_00300 [Candidatus Dependentiae bacterium]|nr:hypothetical protein [Candidatus Dependentiae bacterium]